MSDEHMMSGFIQDTSAVPEECQGSDKLSLGGKSTCQGPLFIFSLACTPPASAPNILWPILSVCSTGECLAMTNFFPDSPKQSCIRQIGFPCQYQSRLPRNHDLALHVHRMTPLCPWETTLPRRGTDREETQKLHHCRGGWASPVMEQYSHFSSFDRGPGKKAGRLCPFSLF